MCDSANLERGLLSTVWGDINSPHVRKLPNPWMKVVAKPSRSSVPFFHAAVWNLGWGWHVTVVSLNIYLVQCPGCGTFSIQLQLFIPISFCVISKYSTEERAENLGSLVPWQTAGLSPAPQSKQLVTLSTSWWTAVRCIGWLVLHMCFPLPHSSSWWWVMEPQSPDNCVFCDFTFYFMLFKCLHI